mmetsp:Transcript_23586/g.40573  ORF Transcript_23586/g.40573 Transcript_23586/m.40573 type:complete len:238 (+) Transcript_23586:14-727(+)
MAATARAEFIMQGFIAGQKLQELLSTLRGLCYAEEKQCSLWELMYKHDIPTVPELQARVYLDEEKPVWVLRYLGRIMNRKDHPATIKSVVDVRTSDNLLNFFSALGYKLDFELIRRGYLFRTSKGITVTVCRIFKLQERHAIDKAQPLDSEQETWVVQLTAVANKEIFEETSTNVVNLLQQLSSVVELTGTQVGQPPPSTVSPSSAAASGAATAPAVAPASGTLGKRAPDTNPNAPR